MKLPLASGKDLVKVAVNLGFEIRRQKGSHVILKRDNVLLVIPQHKNLKKGTLIQIIKVLGISKEQLVELL